MSGPLEGLRVIELCDELGQLAGKLLADMGADVIKVEPPAGSAARTVGPFVADKPGPNRSLNFWYHNTNKRSAILDWANSPADRERLSDLICGADIVIEDLAPGTLLRQGIDLKALEAACPRLIACSITPFGQAGPWVDYRVNDLVALALGGPMAMNGYSPGDLPGAPPIHGNGDQAYNTACHFAVHGILAALLYRDATGLGQSIDCSMHEALSSTTEVGLPYWLYKKTNVQRQTGRHAAANATEPWYYETADGKGMILYGIGRDNRSWTQLKRWYQSEGFGLQFDEPRFDTPANRQGGRGAPEAAEISAETARFIAGHTAEEVYRGGQLRDQAWGVVRTPDETLDDQHWHDRGFFVGITGEDQDTPALMPGAPYIFSKTPWALRRPAPKLGEHTAEVISELEQR